MIDVDKSIEKSIVENEQQLDEPLARLKRKKVKVDILFLLDATSTMRPSLTCLTNVIAKVIRKFAEYKVDWRVAVWSYCNPKIGVHWLKRNAFVEKEGDVIAQLQGISADGIDSNKRPLLDALFSVSDITSMPEDLELEEVLRNSWRYGNPSRGKFRIVFVLTDGMCFDNCLHNDSLLTLKDLKSRFEVNNVWLQIAAPDYVDFDGYDDINIYRSNYSPIPIQKDETGAHALMRYIRNDLEDDIGKILWWIEDYDYSHEPLDPSDIETLLEI